MLFAGASGTGKTMSASAIAAEVGLDFYRIDLSRVVSKYIGETERTLNPIFTRGRERGSLFRRGRRPTWETRRGQGAARPLRQH